MRELITYTLDFRGIEYVRNLLCESGYLSKEVINTIDLDFGRVSTTLPELPALELLYDFNEGGIASSSNNMFSLAEFVKLNFYEDVGIFVCEDLIASLTDPYVKQIVSPHFIYNDKLFHYIARTCVNKETIARVIDTSTYAYPPFVGFLSNAVVSFASGVRLDHSTIVDIARSVRTIIVGAYDGEGYIIWSID